MKSSILIISLLIFGCSTQKTNVAEISHRVYFINYSKKDAEIYLFTKTNIEDNFEELFYSNLKYLGTGTNGKYDAISTTVGPNENYFKAKYYVEGELMGTREYTKEELLIKKKGELAINKRGKIQK